jgi:hypothetical protein
MVNDNQGVHQPSQVLVMAHQSQTLRKFFKDSGKHFYSCLTTQLFLAISSKFMCLDNEQKPTNCANFSEVTILCNDSGNVVAMIRPGAFLFR